MRVLSGPLAAAVALAVLSAGCGEPAPRIYEAHGIVEDVARAEGQALVAHDDIPGLMPAMTMNFDVKDPEVLAALRSGQEIDFAIAFDGRSYRITQVEVVGEVEPGDGWARLGDVLVRADPAPPFELVDQAGSERSLAQLSGTPILLDFVFTQCAGPCPVLTARHVAVQRTLAREATAPVQLVSISVDPENDTPEALSRYASARGVDFTNWWFLTGEVARVEEVLLAYGVGRTRDDQGTLEHVVASFLIDGDGQIVKRYLGLGHAADEIAADLAALAGATRPGRG